MKKSLKLAAAAVLAAASLSLVKPIRTFASQTGSYMFHALYNTGPVVFYGAAQAWTGPDSTSRIGVTITTGTPSAMSGIATWHFLGALGGKPATSTEGDMYYDIAAHTIAMATATKSDNSAWLKANTATTGAPWTTY